MKLLTKQHGIVEHQELVEIARQNNRKVSDLLAGATFYYDKPRENKEKSAELMHLEYNALTANMHQKQEQTIAQDIREINRVLALPMNLVFSIGATFAAVYYFAHGIQDVYRVLLGLFAAIVVAAAELYFVIRDLDRQDKLKVN
jgi:hypothetical protein